VIPIIEDARHPQKYRMLVPMVDVVFADVAQPDQVWPQRRFAWRCESPACWWLLAAIVELCSQAYRVVLVFSCLSDLALQACRAYTRLVDLQARIVGLNAQYFLKNSGNFVISIKASCIDSTAPPEAVFAREVKKMQEMQLKPKEQVTLEPYERDHAMVVGVFRQPKKEAAKA